MRLPHALVASAFALAGPSPAQMPPYADFAPQQVVADPARNRVVASNIRPSTSIEIFDTATRTRRSVPVPNVQRPDIDAATGRVFVPSSTQGSLFVIDGGTAAILSVVPLGSTGARAAIVDAPARRVFVLEDGGVAIVDADSLAADHVAFAGSSYQAVVNPLDHLLYAASSDLRTLVVVDAAKRTSKAIPVAGTTVFVFPEGWRIATLANQILMLVDSGTSLAVIDAATHAVTAIPLPAASHHDMALDSVHGKVYIATIGASALAVVDVATRSVTSIPLPGGAWRVAVNESTGKIYAALNQGGVAVIDGATLAQFTLPSGASPREMVVDATHDLVHVADGGALLVIDGKRATPAAADIGMAVEYYRRDVDHYLLTTNFAEMDNLDHQIVWVRTGATVGAFLTGDATPVCRFYLPPGQGDSHVMLPGAAECEATHARFPAFVYESPAVFRVAMPDPIAGTCSQGLAPAYRLWNQRKDPNHRYVIDTATRDAMVAAGSVLEGFGPDPVGMCVPVPATYTLH